MPSFTIDSGNSQTFTDTTSGDGFLIDFGTLDNGFSITVNSVDLFFGGPAGAPNELEFQTNGTFGQTVRFADGDIYGTDTPEVWQLGRSSTETIIRLIVNPDGSVELYGVKADGGELVPLELFNGLTVNSSAIAAAWNPAGPNTVVLDQSTTGPTNAAGDFESVVCFTSGTLIETKHGPCLIENLNVGDLVRTYDRGFRPIRWIGKRELSVANLVDNTKLRPIRIEANALGNGFPSKDLVVSRQHRLLVSSQIAVRMFDAREILIPANKLLSLDGVSVVEDCAGGVVYYHILFDQHELVWSNGALTEALYTGTDALKTLTVNAQKEIFTIFPECFQPDFQPSTVRHIPKNAKEFRKLVDRHRANQKPLFS